MSRETRKLDIDPIVGPDGASPLPSSSTAAATASTMPTPSASSPVLGEAALSYPYD
jgi:hypothetical protein